MTPAHRTLFDKVDSIQATIDFIRITDGPFTGKMYQPDGRPCSSFTKFLHNFRYVIFRAIADLPAEMDAVSLIEAIFYELRPKDVNTEYVTEFNQLVFNLLMTACDEEALDIVLRYERSDNSQQQMKKDGRRALFALMRNYSPPLWKQSYSPLSADMGNDAAAKLESTCFQQNKHTINQQIADFYINVAAFEAASAKKLDTFELWALVTSAIKGRDWKPFRLTTTMQKEYKDCKSFWLVDQVRKYVLAVRGDRDASPPHANDLRDAISKLTASVEAIQTRCKRQANVEVSSHPESKRVRRDVRAYDVRMGPCNFCGGAHRHRDCHTLRTTYQVPLISTYSKGQRNARQQPSGSSHGSRRNRPT
jgi:hypothetical protein